DQELDYVTVDFQSKIPNWIIRKYSVQNLESLLDMGESPKLEYKLKIPRGAPEEFLESVSAFANTEGGKILLGVDDNANVVGLEKNQTKRIEDLVSAHIEPEISVIITNVVIDEKKVTIVDIPEGSDKPYILKNRGPYKRVGGTDKVFSRLDYEKLKPIYIEVTGPDDSGYY
ncbi:MAG: ATP-binding protein, partial [Candidatus Thorarchaeota archaeon]